MLSTYVGVIKWNLMQSSTMIFDVDGAFLGNRVRWCLHETFVLSSSSRFYYVCYVTSFPFCTMFSTTLKATLAREKRTRHKKRKTFLIRYHLLWKNFTYILPPNFAWKAPEKNRGETFAFDSNSKWVNILNREIFTSHFTRERKKRRKKFFHIEGF